MQTQTSARIFEMGQCIGRGGFGEVYRATMISQAGLRSDVAVKTLHQNLTAQRDAIARLADEARMLSMLRHRAVLRVHDLVMLADRAALVTEYLEGADLSGIIRRNPRGLPLRITLHIISEVAAALYAAYSSYIPGQPRKMRIVHRDIKPANIRILPDGGVRVMDFGIARSNQIERSSDTETGLIVGTWGYIAPERVGGDTVEAPSDIYALGCVLYECLTGTSIFDGLSQRNMARLAVVEEEHTDYIDGQLEHIRYRIPDDLYQMLSSMLDYHAEYRPKSQDVEVSLEYMGDLYAGDNMRAWCRKQPWPEPEFTEGDIAGLVLSETTLATSRPTSHLRGNNARTMSLSNRDEAMFAPRPAPDPPAKNRQIGLVLATVTVVLLVLIGAAVIAAGGLGATLWWTGLFNETTAARPVPAPQAQISARSNTEATAPSATPPPAPTPASPNTKVDARPSTAAERPSSGRAKPSPLVKVTLSGGTSLQLRRAAERYSPGDVPPGTYEAWVSFNDAEPVHAGDVTLPEGGRVHITCSQTMSLCRAVSR